MINKSTRAVGCSFCVGVCLCVGARVFSYYPKVRATCEQLSFFSRLHVHGIAVQAVHGVVKVLPVVPSVVHVLYHLAHVLVRVVREVTRRRNSSIYLFRNTQKGGGGGAERRVKQ